MANDVSEAKTALQYDNIAKLNIYGASAASDIAERYNVAISRRKA